MKYDYRQAMVKDIKNYIIDNYMEPAPDMTRDDYIEALDDELWGVDMITGNGGFYYGTEEECAGYIGYGITEFVNAQEEYGWEWSDTMREQFREAPARFIDCMIRTTLLAECIDKAVEELGYFKEEE